jgi:hypothetical protein
LFGLECLLGLVQGAYYLSTGLRALAHRRSFEAVTGPKVDFWLVRTVGVLVSAIGATLIMAGLRRRVSTEIKLLALASSLGLAGIDIVYGLKGRISKIYLLDASGEIALTVLWLRAEHASRNMRF